MLKPGGLAQPEKGKSSCRPPSCVNNPALGVEGETRLSRLTQLKLGCLPGGREGAGSWISAPADLLFGGGPSLARRGQGGKRGREAHPEAGKPGRRRWKG